MVLDILALYSGRCQHSWADIDDDSFLCSVFSSVIILDLNFSSCQRARLSCFFFSLYSSDCTALRFRDLYSLVFHSPNARLEQPALKLLFCVAQEWQLYLLARLMVRL